MYRQILRRAERDGISFRIMRQRRRERGWPSSPQSPTNGFVPSNWQSGSSPSDSLTPRTSAVSMRRCRRPADPAARARLRESAGRSPGKELSVDLMRYRSDGPSVMDFLIVSLLLEGRARGYQRFNLGMAPLSSVGDLPAHTRESVWLGCSSSAGEQWYNFKGLRFYKDKFEPEWVPGTWPIRTPGNGPLSLRGMRAHWRRLDVLRPATPRAANAEPLVPAHRRNDEATHTSA